MSTTFEKIAITVRIATLLLMLYLIVTRSLDGWIPYVTESTVMSSLAISSTDRDLIIPVLSLDVVSRRSHHP